MMRLILAVIAVVLLLAPLHADAQIQWFKYSGNPVMGPAPAGKWDDTVVVASQVIFKDSLYRIWYWGGRTTTPPEIGYATSRDGVNWARSTSNPVLRRGTAGTWDSLGVIDACVIFEDTQYRMWYMGTTDFGMGPYRFGYATSPDGIQWTKDAKNPVFGPMSWFNTYPGPNYPSVLPDSGGSYHMWFTGASNLPAIGYAHGSDPITWTTGSSPVLSGPAQPWSNQGISGPRVISNGQGGYEMWYTNRYAYGYATSPDETHWTAYTGNPVLRADTGTWEAGGIDLPCVLFDGTLYHMWYTAGVYPALHIGYAVSPKGFSAFVRPPQNPIDRTKDTVRVFVRVADPTGQSYTAVMRSTTGSDVDTVKLFDDGLHGDSLAHDGLFANRWIPGDSAQYTFSVKPTLHDTLTFSELSNIDQKLVVAVRDDNRPVPSVYALEQSYPNPFNPQTTIRYSVPYRSHIRLTVYNTLGQHVATLVNADMDPGYHSVQFDGSGLASGVYFYTLQAGSFVETKKLLLIR